jgi:prepilin-type N-terminal cleavage/methylation domain-containing protein
MKKEFSNTAFSLIELLVALTLLSIVILGIFSINGVLVNNNQDYGQRYLVRSETEITLNHILKNASLAVGSANINDNGILLGADLGDANSFCIHQAGINTGIGNNLIDNASDIWLCYELIGNQINWCAETYNAGITLTLLRGASKCSTSATLIAGHPITFLGRAFSITRLNGVLSTPSFDGTTGFSITIQNCLDNTAVTCLNTGTSTDPVINPEVQISGSIFPPQMSTE